MILEEYTPGPVAAVDTKTIDSNAIASAAAANSGITHTTGVCDDSDATTSIFTPIKPTTETEPNNEHEYSEDDEEDNDDEYGAVEEL